MNELAVKDRNAKKTYGDLKAVDNLFRVTDFVIRHLTVDKVEPPPPRTKPGETPAEAPQAQPAPPAPAA